MPRRPGPRSRPALGALGGLALLAGLWAALLMLGLHVPRPRPDFAEVHGPLMVLGFLGTLIALERAVPLDEPVGYLAPAAAGLGGVALTVWRAMITRGMADVLQHHPQQRPVPTDSPAAGFSALKP